MRKIYFAAMLILTALAGVKADGPLSRKALDVEKIAVGTAIDNKELMGTSKEFEASVSRVYCWAKVTSVNPPTKIKFVWYADDKKEAEVPLDIKYPTVRTWSNKTIWPGQWRVDVATDSGEVLSSTEFKVQDGNK